MTTFSDPADSSLPAPAVRIQDIDKSFGDIHALDHVTFDVPERSIFGLLGPNGAGKTTLFSIIANFLHQDDGRVEVLGIDVARISELRGRMTILPQDAQFQRNVPILEQLVFFRMLDGRERQEAEQEVTQTLDRVGLKDYARRSTRALSHGMMKRLGIAQAFLGEPEVILLDEPTSGLDPANARQIRDLLREFQVQATVVISSHNLAEIQELCDHVAILDKGKLVTCGSVHDLTRSDRELELRLSRSLEHSEVAHLRNLPGIAGIQAGAAQQYTFFVDLRHDGSTWDDVVAATLRALLDLGAVPRQLSEGSSLETHFLRVTSPADED